MLTSGTLAALQEFLASWIAHDRSKHGHYLNTRVPKMAAYGAFVSAPLGHVLITLLQRVFAGRSGLRAKILQILVSNLIVRCFFLPQEKRPEAFPPEGVKTAFANPFFFPILRYPRSKTWSTSPLWPSSPAQGHITKCELLSK